MGARLMALVADGDRERVYLTPTEALEAAAGSASPDWEPDGDVPARHTGGTCVPYGLEHWSDLFTRRQLVTLNTLADLVTEAREQAQRAALADGTRVGATSRPETAVAYANAIAVHLSETVSKLTAYHCTMGVWRVKEEKTGRAFGRQSIPMVWDFPECNPFAGAGGDWDGTYHDCAKVLQGLGLGSSGHVRQYAAQRADDGFATAPLISTDPPYYDNVAYADLSDFYYVWLRRSLRTVLPELFATVAVPKAEELVAAFYRHPSKQAAEAFFLEGMTDAMRLLARRAHEGLPVTIYLPSSRQRVTISAAQQVPGGRRFWMR